MVFRPSGITFVEFSLPVGKDWSASFTFFYANIERDKSFADDLIKERGIVSSRVALLLRSAEIKPLFHRFVLFEHHLRPSFIFRGMSDASSSGKNHKLPGGVSVVLG